MAAFVNWRRPTSSRAGWAFHPSETARANTENRRNRIESGLSTGTKRSIFSVVNLADWKLPSWPCRLVEELDLLGPGQAVRRIQLVRGERTECTNVSLDLILCSGDGHGADE
jgi:hypothetical protein